MTQTSGCVQHGCLLEKQALVHTVGVGAESRTANETGSIVEEGIRATIWEVLEQKTPCDRTVQVHSPPSASWQLCLVQQAFSCSWMLRRLLSLLGEPSVAQPSGQVTHSNGCAPSLVAEFNELSALTWVFSPASGPFKSCCSLRRLASFLGLRPFCQRLLGKPRPTHYSGLQPGTL